MISGFPGIFRVLSVLGFPFVLAAPAAALAPSFDCSKAQSSAEEAVCASDALAEMGLELARLYHAAVNGPNMDAERLKTLKATQRGWIKGRDDCWKSDMGVEACTANEYAFRIYDLRQGYSDARAEDGASLGPFPYVCEGLDVPLSAAFVNTAAPMVALRWGENAAVLPLVEAGSGAKYASEAWFYGPLMFWSKGDEARFAVADGAEMSCVQDDMG